MYKLIDQHLEELQGIFVGAYSVCLSSVNTVNRAISPFNASEVDIELVTSDSDEPATKTIVHFPMDLCVPVSAVRNEHRQRLLQS